ncbi:hypothetical protein [Streptomyces chilikensis]|uniref:Uncharacterized protein n=1 Tax=Streptomyces chilikensis TaxID=1194079 RepID=A0ABV3ER54_9ACTN
MGEKVPAPGGPCHRFPGRPSAQEPGQQDLGPLRGLPGGFAPALTVHVVVTVAGALLAGWSHGRAKALGRR